MSPTPPKSNPWPIAIAAYFAVFGLFIVAFTIYATSQRTDLVGRDYYDQEIRFQQQLDCLNRTQPIHAQVSVTYDALQQSVIIAVPAAHARAQISGRIHFYRPSDASLDRDFRLAFKPDGLQRVDAKKLPIGLWKVRVQWTVNGQEYFFEQPLIIDSTRDRRLT